MVQLAEALTQQVSHADWAMFCKNGSDATSMAMVISRAYREKRKILVARGTYHGASPWNVPYTTGITKEDRAHVVYFEYNDIESLNAAVKSVDGDVAAIYATPFRHEVLYDQFFPSIEYAKECRRLADEQEALLVVDEVRTGCACRVIVHGRTGACTRTSAAGARPSAAAMRSRRCSVRTRHERPRRTSSSRALLARPCRWPRPSKRCAWYVKRTTSNTPRGWRTSCVPASPSKPSGMASNSSRPGRASCPRCCSRVTTARVARPGVGFGSHQEWCLSPPVAQHVLYGEPYRRRHRAYARGDGNGVWRDQAEGGGSEPPGYPGHGAALIPDVPRAFGPRPKAVFPVSSSGVNALSGLASDRSAWCQATRDSLPNRVFVKLPSPVPSAAAPSSNGTLIAQQGRDNAPEGRQARRRTRFSARHHVVPISRPPGRSPAGPG